MGLGTRSTLRTTYTALDNTATCSKECLLPSISSHICTNNPGLQLGYFLKRAGRDYVIFEKNSTAGEPAIPL